MRFLLRVLLIFLVVSAVLSMIRGAFSVRTAQPPRRPTPGAEPEREPESRGGSDGHLVKDPVCGTYIPQNTALRAADSFFCSEECRSQFLAQSKG